MLGFDLSARAWSTLSAGDVALSGAGSSCARPSEAIEQDLGAPERRSTGAVDLDDAGRIVIFGGRSECGLLDDAWRWDPSDGWEELHPASAGESCARRGVSCATLCL